MKTLEQYEFARNKKNYRARLRRRIYNVNTMSRLLDRTHKYLQKCYWLQHNKEVDFSVERINEMVVDVYKIFHKLNYLSSTLMPSCAKRTIDFTAPYMIIDEDGKTEVYGWEYEKKHMNHIEGETEEEWIQRLKYNTIGYLMSYISNCNCLDRLTEYEDVDDHYQDKIDGKVDFDYKEKEND